MKCCRCGLCCSQLSWDDRLIISIHTRSFMNKKVCKFLNKKHLCKIYKKRPKLCKDWKCGVSKL